MNRWLANARSAIGGRRLGLARLTALLSALAACGADAPDPGYIGPGVTGARVGGQSGAVVDAGAVTDTAVRRADARMTVADGPVGSGDTGGGTGGASQPADGGAPVATAFTSAACLACEKRVCESGDATEGDGCGMRAKFAQLDDGELVGDGRQKGKKKKDVGQALLDCFVRTSCWLRNPIDCLCGTAVGAACATDMANGACKREIEDATESVDPATVGARFYSLTYAGLVTQQFAFAHDFCPNECETGAAGGAGGSGGTGGTSVGVDAGGGAGGTGGGPGPQGGASGAAGGSVLGASAACNSCVTRSIDDPLVDEDKRCHAEDAAASCSQLTGDDRRLCEAVEQCFRRTKCWTTDAFEDCYCGTAKGTACATSAVNGACVAEVLAATKTSDPVAVGNRFYDLQYPAAHATVRLVQCEKNCVADCADPVTVTGSSGVDSGVPVSAVDAGVPVTTVDAAPADGSTSAPAPDAGATGGGRYVATAQCAQCEATHVQAGDCEPDIGCDKLSGDDRALCTNLESCFRRTKCWLNDPLDCLCGSSKGVACASAAANGACRAEIQAATRTQDPVQNGTRFYSLLYPAGHATQLLACDKDNCLAECEAPMTVGEPGPFDAAPPPPRPRGGPEAGPPAPPMDAGSGPTGQPNPPGPIVNPTFDTKGEPWRAEYLMLAGWNSRDASGASSSGSLAVTNNNVNQSVPTYTMGGARQCIPAAGDVTYALRAKALVPGGQGQGGAAVAVIFFASSDCTGAAAGSYTTDLVVATDVWSLTGGSVKAPSAARSMAVRLVVQKPYSVPALQALFDDVSVGTQ